MMTPPPNASIAPGSYRSPVRRTAGAALVALVALAATGCDGSRNEDSSTGFGGGGPGPTTLIASDAFVRNTSSEVVRARLADLADGVDELRAVTGSGWVGRQDDVTGYLAELSGGGYGDPDNGSGAAVVEELMGAYGEQLFGIDDTDLALGEASTLQLDETGPAATTIRATQTFDDVPVRDGELVFSLGGTSDDDRLHHVRGRVFPGLDVSTQPQIPAARAARRIAALTGGQTVGDPVLTVLPHDTGVLTWEITVAGVTRQREGLTLSDGLFYLDATTGDVIDNRALAADRAVPSHHRWTRSAPRLVRGAPLPGAGAAAAVPRIAEGPSVEVTGTDPFGMTLTAQGQQTDQGVALIDTTTPTYDAATGTGGIVTNDARDTEQLPGPVYTSDSTQIADPEVISAHALSRAVYDFYAQLGRRSWDDAGSSLVSTVNSENSDAVCNAFYSSTLTPPQMVYGNPCVDGGEPITGSTVDIDTAGHEITHGVIDTSAGLIYAGQSGALNESFADYFGNVIGDAYLGRDSDSFSEQSCTGIPADTYGCATNPDGQRATRYMLDGTGYGDYLSVLNPGLRLGELGFGNQDHGGVHLNSSIWNNSLWTIRSTLAKIDNSTGLESPLAQDFDRIVYFALTTQLGPSSGFVDARTAVEQVAVDAGADPRILSLAREVFDGNDICAGCADVGPVGGELISGDPVTELSPAVSGDQVAWTTAIEGNWGVPYTSSVGASAEDVSSTPDTAMLAFSGDAVVTFESPDGSQASIVRTAPDGTRTELSGADRSTLLAGLGGSAEGAAWQVEGDGALYFVDPAGQVSTTPLPDLGGDAITAVGTGGGVVGLGTEQGRVLAWTPGGDIVELGQVEGQVVNVAAHGTRVLAVTDEGQAAIVGSGGDVTVLSQDAKPYGAAMSADYSVFVEITATLGGGVAEANDALGVFPDTDLFLYSHATGAVYDLLPQPGQQGFPSISGDRLVWQDSVYGGDDILTATIPAGL
ncbi:MAG: Zn-dependent metalloprotease [Nocardioides sp.]|jgi:hypothetical protein|nr:Zn-dependent metalloprotease [Nocardioides sp.]